MSKPKSLIIIGGGTSISEGIQKGLSSKIENKFTLGCNYSFNYFDSTATVFVDYHKFYKEQLDKLKDLGLIIGYKNPNIEMDILKNTLLLPSNQKYTRDLSGGCYNTILCGIFSLSLGIYLLDEGNIFLLGMDYSAQPSKTSTLNFKYKELGINYSKKLEVESEDFNPEDYENRKLKIFNSYENKLAKTHFYQEDLKHQGTGRIQFYYTQNPDRYYDVYKNENKCKIYNVSPYSQINTFPKISYDQMFDMLESDIYNQEELRKDIKIKLGGI